MIGALVVPTAAGSASEALGGSPHAQTEDTNAANAIVVVWTS